MEEFVPAPRAPIGRNETPDTIAGWKALAERLLTRQTCAFHRNVEISSRYAWINRILPSCFKWAAMAAIASHRVRLTLYPLRLDPDRGRRIDIPHGHPGRRNLLPTEDVNLIKATNNAIYDDIFWVHLAYVTAEDGIERLRDLLRADRHYAPVLSGFEAIDRGRRMVTDRMASAEAQRRAADLIWSGNIRLLEHEQCVVVQPNFDRLSCASARLVSLGSATSFEVRGVRQEFPYFTAFYLYSLTRGMPQLCARVHGRASPASTTAGGGSWPALCPDSEGSMPTCTDRRHPAPHPRRSPQRCLGPLRIAMLS